MIWVMLGIFSTAILGITANIYAYRNGFCDGAHWVNEGPGYPSRPPDSWWWYETDEARRLARSLK